MESEKSPKIIGYLLIFLGILVIIFTAFSVYQVFNNRLQPYTLFTFDSITFDLAKLAEEAPPDVDLQQELVKSEMINKPMNLIAHVILMGFLSSIGFKIAQVGVSLVRPIKVKVRQEKKLFD